MTIQPIVEGHGDVPSVPILLRRLMNEAREYRIQINRAIRQPATNLYKQEGIQKAVKLARKQDCSAILIIVDSNDHCPKDIVPDLEYWARQVASNIPCAIVIAHREYEAWFLSTIESLRSKSGILADAASEADPESIRGAKEALEQRMAEGQSYFERIDQPALTQAFDMRVAYQRCRSFRKLVKCFGELAIANGIDLNPWPPVGW